MHAGQFPNVTLHPRSRLVQVSKFLGEASAVKPVIYFSALLAAGLFCQCSPCWAQTGSAAPKTTTSETIARRFMAPSYSCHERRGLFIKGSELCFMREKYSRRWLKRGALRLPRRLFAQELAVECLPGFTSSSLTTCWTLGTALASFSASFFWARVLTEPVRTSVPFLAEA